jgi:hypothetical protein
MSSPSPGLKSLEDQIRSITERIAELTRQQISATGDRKSSVGTEIEDLRGQRALLIRLYMHPRR